MKQTAITIVVPIVKDRIEALDAYLKPIGDNVAKSTQVHFSDNATLHYCSLVIVKSKAAELPCTPVLVLECNVDNDTTSFLKNLIKLDGEFLRQTYDHCKGFNNNCNDKELLDFLSNHINKTNTFYISHPGRTRNDIIRESELQKEIQSYLNNNRNNLKSLPPKELHQSIVNHIQSKDDFNWINTPHQTPWQVRYADLITKSLPTIAIVLGLVIIGLLICGLTGCLAGWLGQLATIAILAWVGRLLILERSDRQDNSNWQDDDLTQVQDFEDRKLQNHLSSITYVKPGFVRLYTIKAILWVVNLFAAVVATQGQLAGIVTIHFARWILLEGDTNEPPRILFYSNYDGSWENYLGEFIDQASLGLSAIWSNTSLGTDRGFPNSTLLGILKAGAKDEQRFKTYARNSQIRESVWYSAYPELSVKNISNNFKIRDNIFAVGDQSADWLKRL